MNRDGRSWERIVAGVGVGMHVLDAAAIAGNLPPSLPVKAPGCRLGREMKRAFLKGAMAFFAFSVIRSPAAAEPSATMPLKALTAPALSDWTGLYLGGHFGYATGTSNWVATQGGAAAPTLNGSLDLFNSYDAFKGTGSFFAGLQAGYNHMFSSRLLVGIEADFSAPNTIAGSETISSALSGQASYRDTVLQAETARGRIGYVFDHWLVYGTGGVAWTYDKLERTQLIGMPVGGSAVVGTTEAALLWRWGWAAGAGVEIPIAPNWRAKLEYLATEFGNRQKRFPAAGQAFTSDLSMQSLRLGVNYQLGADLSKSDVFTKGISPVDSDNFNLHGQTTFVSQYALPFRAPYSGQNSLAPNAGCETFDVAQVLRSLT
jgi:high affinity Mn2+ porin